MTRCWSETSESMASKFISNIFWLNCLNFIRFVDFFTICFCASPSVNAATAAIKPDISWIIHLCDKHKFGDDCRDIEFQMHPEASSSLLKELAFLQQEVNMKCVTADECSSPSLFADLCNGSGCHDSPIHPVIRPPFHPPTLPSIHTLIHPSSRLFSPPIHPSICLL